MKAAADKQARCDPEAFVATHTRPERPALVPEIALSLASEVLPLWQASETELERIGLPPPYWAFAWAGGQALARYLLDHPEVVRGRRLLDFAAGSGIAGLAALRAGAASVLASEIDPFARAALKRNAEINGLPLEVTGRDLLESEEDWEVILAGDVCYERPMAERVFAWLCRRAGQGALVLLGDPGRAYLPKRGLAELASYSVATSRELEDRDVKLTKVWRVLA